MTVHPASMAVVTGVGLASGYGVGTAPCMDGLLRGEAAPPARRTQAWPNATGHVSLPGPDLSEVVETLPPQPLRSLNAETLLTQAVARMALRDAGLDAVGRGSTRLGVVVSTQHAGLQDYAEQLWTGTREEGGMVSPTRGPQTGFNAPAGHLSIRLGSGGPNVTMLNGAVGGVDAIGYALGAIGAGRADVMLVCGVEVVAPATVPLLLAVDGPTEPRPFDRDRRGPGYGNVAAALLLECAGTSSVGERRPRARVAGTATAYSPNEDLREAASRALRDALEASETEPDEVAACFAGANGSLCGDASEASALSELLGTDIPTCAIKGGVGECLGAAGVAQAVVAVLSLERGEIPPTPGFRTPDSSLAIRVTTRQEPLRAGPVVVHVWDSDCASGAAVLFAGDDPGSTG